MRIRWLGQSCFEITGSNGTRIVTDPFAHENESWPGCKITYPTPDVEADIVTVSHLGHFDHDAVDVIKGNPVVITKPGTTKAMGIDVTGFGTYHRTADGLSAEPFNNVFYWECDGLRLCHLGDLGHVLSDDQSAQIQNVDILFVPVGEGFTMPFSVILENLDRISPRLVIPMHYKTDQASFLESTLADFLKVCDLKPFYPGATLTLMPNNMPVTPSICVLNNPSTVMAG